MKKSLLFMAALSAATLCASAQDAPAAGEYYIRNVKTGMYLNGGQSWGTKMIVRNNARAFELIDKTGGAFLIKSSCGYIKGDGYVDGHEGNAATVYIEKQANGHYTLDIDGKYFGLEHNSNDNSIAYNTYAPGVDNWFSGLGCIQSYDFVGCQLTETFDATNEEILWDFITHEEMLAELANASDDNPMEASFLIKAHAIDSNDSDNNTAWQTTKNGEKADLVFPSLGWGYYKEITDNGNPEWAISTTYAWYINDDATADVEDTVSQDATGAPAGTYEVTYRLVNQANAPLTLTFNDTEADVLPHEGTDLWYHAATGYFADPANTKKAVFKVGDDGKIAIKMTKQTKAGEQNRFAFKSFILKYHGTNSSLGGVEGIETDAFDADAPAEYYNLQGIRVAEPTTGLYIVRQGSKVSKQLIRK